MRSLPLLLLATLAAAAPARAADVSNLVVRLGRDTTAFETTERTPAKVVVHQTGVSPRVLQRECAYVLKGDAFDRLELTVTPPGATAAVQTVTGGVDGDSLRIEIRNGGGAPRPLVVAFPKGAIASSYSSPWWLYETLAMRLAAAKQDRMTTPVYFIGFPSTEEVTLSRIGRDSVAIVTGHSDVFHAKVDRAGHLLGVLPIAGTGQFAADRVASLDLAGLTATFAAREKAGAGIGVLSPRDTVNAVLAHATLWVDYGRPGKRGRDIFGNVVPFGAVWRTGANAATQFRTDQALDFGGTVVPAGFYTLWTLPTADGWTLIVNSQTGQWGTEHDASKDLYRIPMQVTALPDPVEHFTIQVPSTADGGRLEMDWDTTRASAEFKVQRP